MVPVNTSLVYRTLYKPGEVDLLQHSQPCIVTLDEVRQKIAANLGYHILESNALRSKVKETNSLTVQGFGDQGFAMQVIMYKLSPSVHIVFMYASNETFVQRLENDQREEPHPKT